MVHAYRTWSVFSLAQLIISTRLLGSFIGSHEDSDLDMLKDLNFFPLDVESNIYGITSLEFRDKTNKVLVATLDCRIYCLHYNKFKPQTREVEFTYIPNGAKIISIGALKRGPDDFVIGITHSLAPSLSSKPAAARDSGLENYNNKQTTYYFNIYASESVSTTFDLDYVAQGCQTLRLRYVPYHLFSTELVTANKLTPGDQASPITISRKPIWLLSGGDNSLHAFFESKPYQSFSELPIDDCFPELGSKQGLTLWVDVINIERNPPDGDQDVLFERAIALGFEDGSVRLYHSILTRHKCKFESVRISSFDSYSTIIPAVRLFKVSSSNQNSRLREHLNENTKHNCDTQDQSHHHLQALNLVVVSSTEPSLVFEDVLNNGFDVKYELTDSQRLDCATTVAIGDANADGLNELLIGTHGRELLLYQFDRSDRRYKLSDLKVSNYPIYALTLLDLTGDVSKDLVILLANGILVMQTLNIRKSIQVCHKRLKAALAALARE